MARSNKGLSQKDAAGLLGVSAVTLNRYERGGREPKGEMLTQMANLYGVSIDWLLTGDSSMTTDPLLVADASSALAYEAAQQPTTVSVAAMPVSAPAEDHQLGLVDKGPAAISIIGKIQESYAGMNESQLEESAKYIESLSPNWKHKDTLSKMKLLPGSIQRFLEVRALAFVDAGIPRDSGGGVLLSNGAQLEQDYRAGKLSDKEIYDVYYDRARRGMDLLEVTAKREAELLAHLTKK